MAMMTTNTGYPASGTDPAEIARTLTSVMCEVMKEIDTAGFIVGRRDTLRALARRGLCGRPRYDWAEVTDLGRAVHAVLTAEQAAPMRQQPEQQHQAVDNPHQNKGLRYSLLREDTAEMGEEKLHFEAGNEDNTKTQQVAAEDELNDRR